LYKNVVCACYVCVFNVVLLYRPIMNRIYVRNYEIFVHFPRAFEFSSFLLFGISLLLYNCLSGDEIE
jgi:hypothetical protein